MLTACRLCVTNNANFLISNGNIAMKIMSCTGVEVEPRDELPQLICQTCRLRLEEFYYFRKRCQAADRHLRQLKSQCPNRTGEMINVFNSNEEDSILLREVAKCEPTACSESNATWRREAAQLIRTEMDAYKKELLSRCKQQLRLEIEQQVRNEMQEQLRTDDSKQCRLELLDSLFYGLESVFVQKRNEVVCEQTIGSEGFVSDLEAAETENASTILSQQDTYSQCPSNEPLEDTNINALEMPVVDLLDDEPKQQDEETVSPRSRAIKKKTFRTPAPIVPLAMVEINMQNSQLSHLREELKSSSFLTATAAAATAPRKFESPQAKLFSKTRKRAAKYENKKWRICRKHSMGKSKVFTDVNCYRCRLRGSQGLNKSVS